MAERGYNRSDQPELIGGDVGSALLPLGVAWDSLGLRPKLGSCLRVQMEQQGSIVTRVKDSRY
jgi:hypothetical protein